MTAIKTLAISRCFLLLTFCASAISAAAGQRDEELFTNDLADDLETDLTSDDVERGAADWEHEQKAEQPGNRVETGIFASGPGGNLNQFEGDISNSNRTKLRQLEATSGRQHAAIQDKTAVWPNSTIPYKVSSKFTPKARIRIAEALTELQRRTCVQFVPRLDQVDYVFFGTSHSHCSSDVGRVGGKQEVTLGTRECFIQAGVIVHELMHALGFYHEQARFDRDQYVRINWANIDPSMDGNFMRYDDFQASVLGTPYDFDSIMHYPSNAFSRNGQPTIEPRIRGQHIGQRRHLSDFDVFEANALYSCPGDNPRPSQKHLDDHIVDSCNGEPYQIFTHGCCNNTHVYALGQYVCCAGQLKPPADMKFGFRMECCGNVPISLPTLCCNESTSFNSEHFICCQNEVYSKNTHECCGGKLFERPLGVRTEYTGCCGNKGIDFRHHGCCNFTTAYSYTTEGCCVNKVYSQISHTCCGTGVVKELPPGTAFRFGMCCNDTPFDAKRHACCNDTDLFDPFTHLCCNGTVHDRATTACCHIGSVYKGIAFDKTVYGCCGDYQLVSQVYNLSTHGCCDGVAVPVDAGSLPHDVPYVACCLNSSHSSRPVAYDPVKQTCCGGRLHQKFADDGWTECCGTEAYSTATEDCCEEIGVIYNKRVAGCCFDRLIYNRTAGERCCGGTVYSVDEYRCCDDQLSLTPPGEGSTNCCGTRAYRRESHGCCGGEIYQSDSQDCCRESSGHRIYNESTHDCCLNTVLPVPQWILAAGDDWRCCGDRIIHRTLDGCCNGVAFNDSTEACCKGVLNAAKPRGRCCDEQSYSEETEICCDSVVSSLPLTRVRGYISCCGTVAYNENHRGCCAGQIYRRKSQACCEESIADLGNRTYTYQSCCGMRPYDAVVEKCCGELVRPVPQGISSRHDVECCGTELYLTESHSCCGTMVFNSSRQSCCEDVVVPKPEMISSNYRCCGLTPYSNHLAHCCGTTVFSRNQTADWQPECCGELQYNPNESTCCLGNVVCPLDYGEYY